MTATTQSFTKLYNSFVQLPVWPAKIIDEVNTSTDDRRLLLFISNKVKPLFCEQAKCVT